MRPVCFRLPVYETTTFIPAGCLHWPIGEKDLIKRWVSEVQESPNAWTVLMGDTCDSARSHYRTHIRSYREDENSQLQLDEWQRKEVAELAELLKPIKQQIAGAILGNHYWEYNDGTNSEQYLCQLLGIPYLGPAGVVRVEYVNRSRKSIDATQVVFLHHAGGSRGSRTLGGDVNGLTRLEQTIEADIYVLSHTHRRYGLKESKLTVTTKGTPRLREKTTVLVRSGAFLKGYKEDNPVVNQPHFPSYAEKEAYRPTNLGWVALETKWTCKHNYEGKTNRGNDWTPQVTVRY